MNALYDIIGIPFGYLMLLINRFFNNYAFSIIIFTVVTKILMFPVNYKTQKSSAAVESKARKAQKELSEQSYKTSAGAAETVR